MAQPIYRMSPAVRSKIRAVMVDLLKEFPDNKAIIMKATGGLDKYHDAIDKAEDANDLPAGSQKTDASHGQTAIKMGNPNPAQSIAEIKKHMTAARNALDEVEGITTIKGAPHPGVKGKDAKNEGLYVVKLLQPYRDAVKMALNSGQFSKVETK